MLKKPFLSRLLPIIILFTFLSLGAACKKADPKPLPEEPKLGEEPTISIFRSKSGATESIKIEEYVKGVVAAEIGEGFPLEALKAQAIAARTMTLAKINYENGTKEKHNTDVSDDHKEFQAYDPERISPVISQAVDETKGQVVKFNGKYAYTLFHSLSKNKTASIEEGFPELLQKNPELKDYITPVDTQGFAEAPSKYKAWIVKVPKAKLAEIFNTSASKLGNVRLGEKGPSGRILTLTNGKKSVPMTEVRRVVGPDTLFSTNINSLSQNKGFYIFSGDGWGHGCGLEQYGAKVMASQGKLCNDIIVYYYPGTVVEKVYQ